MPLATETDGPVFFPDEIPARRCVLNRLKDIVLVLSDQHNGRYTGLAGGGMTDTPCLDQLAQSSTVFSAAYCNAPLCVPSRSSFLTGRLPHEIGIFDNDALLPEDMPTIAHAMTAAGYDTVLAGRMHFKGHDQNHGFARRLTGDITTQYWGVARTDLGDFAGSLQASGCRKVAGYGISPTQEYDDAVVQSAVELLRQPRSKPLFLVVGLYAPHFPFVCPEEDFRDSIDPEESLDDASWPCHPCYDSLVQPVEPRQLRTIRAAYRGMVRQLDRRIGELHREFRRSSTDGIFIYTSDHGEQLGKRGLYGKKTLYEDSVRIPMIWEDGSRQSQVISREVSLLDLNRTILDAAGADLPQSRGVNLFSGQSSPVEIETVTDDASAFLKSVILGGKKLTHYPDGNRVCDLSSDEQEIGTPVTEGCDELLACLPSPEEEAAILERQRLRMKSYPLLKAWGKQMQPRDTARFPLSRECVTRPDPYRGQELLDNARPHTQEGAENNL